MAKLERGSYKGIWVIAEIQNKSIHSVSLELLSKARELKQQNCLHEPVTAVLLGENPDAYTGILSEAGAEAVIIAQHPALEIFQNETYALVLQGLIEERRPAVVLMGATAMGSDLAPTLGAKLQTGVAAHCVDLRLNEKEDLVAVVPAFGGKVLGDILCPECRPQMATVRPGILAKPVCYRKAACKVEQYNPAEALKKDSGRVKAVSFIPEEMKGVSLEEAEVVIAGGFGAASHEMWELVEQLAEVTGGAVGCTRPPLDAGVRQRRTDDWDKW